MRYFAQTLHDGARRLPPIAALAGLVSIVPLDARAATDSDTMTVTATVIASCSVTADDLAFGDYDPVSSSPLSGATTIEVTCTNGTGYVVSLDEGAGVGASIAERLMTSGSDTLSYTLFRDAAHTQVWGNASGVDTVDGTGTGVAEVLDVYGLVEALQTAPAGAYTDSVTVTVTY